MFEPVGRNADIKLIDRSVKNRFRLSRLEEKDPNGDFLSEYVQKINSEGYAYCTWCDEMLKYGGNGKSDLKNHAKCEKHKWSKFRIKTLQRAVGGAGEPTPFKLTSGTSVNVHGVKSCRSQVQQSGPVLSNQLFLHY